ncbi:MAG: transglutaminaseTgpA domain-containing protein [Microthrixaceae bacterium]
MTTGEHPGGSDLGRPILAAVVTVQLWVALSGAITKSTPLIGLAAVLCAVLAVFGLRSVPLRFVAWAATALSGATLVRFGLPQAVSGLASMWGPLVWLCATVVSLAFTSPRGLSVSRATVAGAGASMVAIMATIAGTGLLVGPRAATLFDTGTSLGESMDLGDNFSGNPLDATSSLDMTTRPQLTDRVVMSVTSPIGSFWRSEVFDSWDGSRWTRSTGRDGRPLTDGTVTPPREDLAGMTGETLETEVRIETGYATALPVAPTAVSVEAPGSRLAQRSDGSIVVMGRPLGRGATYQVTSRRVPLDADRLHELGTLPIPDGIRDRFASVPAISSRTMELARQVTEGAADNFERVLALQEWMGANTRYDIEAPLSPPGVDVVDHFLFESQLGWCEQIASSLVVMARSIGIPARLATGYVPGEWDSINGRFVVRERDAHAWAEVWFPEVGWVPFDPTAEVPLTGTESPEVTSGSAVSDVVGALLLLVAAAWLLGPGTLRFIARRTERLRERSRHRALIRKRWDVAEEAAIEKLAGAVLERQRYAWETLPAFARCAVAEGAPPNLVERAESVEVWRYGAPRTDQGGSYDPAASTRGAGHRARSG